MLTRMPVGAIAKLALFLFANLFAGHVHAFRVQNVPPVELENYPGGIHPGGMLRWNADPHEVDGVERSLQGGLRYSISGGSYEAFLDEFQWAGTPPSVAEFQTAVEQAFADWEQIDPATGLGTAIRFVPDLDTPVVAVSPQETLEEGARLNPGAEIDLRSFSHDFLGGRAVVYGDPYVDKLTLTSGIQDYQAVIISGADVEMSNNREWESLDSFRLTLSHEIGHALGLADVDLSHLRGCCRTLFYDDNLDISSREAARETLLNSFADLIDPLDPNNTPGLVLFEFCSDAERECASDPGLDTPGVDIHMETSFQARSQGPTNDEFAGRQFLYPFIKVTGDFDTDQNLSTADIDLLFNELEASEPRAWFDVNGDGVVNEEDPNFWVTSLIGTHFGDADLNGEVDFSDFLTLSSSFGRDGGWAEGDFDGTGDVAFPDFLVLSSNFGSSGAPINSVPEPSSTTAFLLAGISLVCVRRLYDKQNLERKN